MPAFAFTDRGGQGRAARSALPVVPAKEEAGQQQGGPQTRVKHGQEGVRRQTGDTEKHAQAHHPSHDEKGLLVKKAEEELSVLPISQDPSGVFSHQAALKTKT